MNKRSSCTILMAVIVAASMPLTALAQSEESNFKRPASTLWSRYVDAGDAALKKNDLPIAKRYLLGALTEVEITVHQGKAQHVDLIRLSTLERDLGKIYADDISGSADSTKQLGARSEQVSTYYRFAELNNQVVKPSNLLASKATERYRKARADYDKALQLTKTSKTAEHDSATHD